MSLKIIFIFLATIIALSAACNNDDDSDDDSTDSDDTIEDPPAWIGSSWELDIGESPFWVRAKYKNIGGFLLFYKDGFLKSLLLDGEWQSRIGLGDINNDLLIMPATAKVYILKNSEEIISYPYPSVGEYQPTFPMAGCLTNEFGYVFADDTSERFMSLMQISLTDGEVTTIIWPDEDVYPSIANINCNGTSFLAPIENSVFRYKNFSWTELGVVSDHMEFLDFGGWIRDDGDKVWTLTYASDTFPESGTVPYGGLVPSLLGALEDGVHTQIDIEGNRYVMMDRADEGDLFLVRQTWGADADDVYRVHADVFEYIDGEGFSSEMPLEGAADYLIAKDISSPSPDTVIVLTETRENIQPGEADDAADDMAEEKSSTWDSRGVIWGLEDGAFRKVEMPEELQDSKISWDGIHAVAP